LRRQKKGCQTYLVALHPSFSLACPLFGADGEDVNRSIARCGGQGDALDGLANLQRDTHGIDVVGERLLPVLVLSTYL